MTARATITQTRAKSGEEASNREQRQGRLEIRRRWGKETFGAVGAASSPSKKVARQANSGPRAIGAPAINVAESKDTIEVTIELAGVDEKDINVSLDRNQPVISGEKKEETKKDEKDWHVEERSYGSFYRSMSLPFKPEDGSVEAHLDKGVLHVNIKKPAEVAKSVKTIEIKPGAPTKAAG